MCVCCRVACTRRCWVPELSLRPTNAPDLTDSRETYPLTVEAPSSSVDMRSPRGMIHREGSSTIRQERIAVGLRESAIAAVTGAVVKPQQTALERVWSKRKHDTLQAYQTQIARRREALPLEYRLTNLLIDEMSIARAFEANAMQPCSGKGTTPEHWVMPKPAHHDVATRGAAARHPC